MRERGDDSPDFLRVALATSGTRQNHFIDGYIQSHVDGACLDFQSYIAEIFGREIFSIAITRRLGEFDVQVLRIEQWPGFRPEDWTDINEYAERVTKIREGLGTYRSEKQCRAEAEVYLALSKENEGKYNLRGHATTSGSAFFVSQSGVLNVISSSTARLRRFAWKPEAFYRFLLCFPTWTPSEDYLHQCMLGEYFTSGIQIIDKKRYSEFFSKPIRQARLAYKEVAAHFHQTVEERFARGIDEAFDKTPDLEKPFFIVQMAAKTAEAAARSTAELRDQVTLTEKERKDLEFFRRKQAKKARKAPKPPRRGR